MSDDEKPDDSEPTPERQAELRTAYEANVVAGKLPYEGVRIGTRGELYWVMQERKWSGDYGMLPEGYEWANLSGVDLNSVNLSGANLNSANLGEAVLELADLRGANFIRTDLSKAHMKGADLSGADLRGANLSGADLYHANLSGAELTGNLSGATLVGANLSGATLVGANLSGAVLSGANLSAANLERADLSGADLRRARMDVTTDLLMARLDTHMRLADVVWNGVPLTRLNWEDVAMLGDEQVARESSKDDIWQREFKVVGIVDSVAVIANRQVATVLRSQGLNEHADRFAFRAQLCQRRLLRMQRHYLRHLGSLLLDLISGYGYRPLRSFATYLLVVTVFGLAYWALGIQTGHTLTWNEAGVVSLTAFHGRGFFATAFQPGDPQAAVAAVEAVIGLLIEIIFIATFTNRFFAR